MNGKAMLRPRRVRPYERPEKLRPRLDSHRGVCYATVGKSEAEPSVRVLSFQFPHPAL